MALTRATSNELYFFIKNYPGPFRVIMGLGHMLERHGSRQKFELTLRPVEAGIELLGHEREFKLPFEVALMGATTKYGHGISEPRNVRMLGRFLITGEVQKDRWNGRDVSLAAAPVLDTWQWEVVFNPSRSSNTGTGFVAKLLNPLPDEWTL